MMPSTALVITVPRLRLHDLERLAGEFALAVPELKCPGARHKLPVVLEHIAAIVDRSDGREQRMLAARLKRSVPGFLSPAPGYNVIEVSLTAALAGRPTTR